MNDDIKAIRDARLSVRIMNLTREKLPHNLRVDDISMTYRMGYRDARHDAADLAAEADERIARLLDALEQAQAECAAWRARAVKVASLAQPPAADQPTA